MFEVLRNIRTPGTVREQTPGAVREQTPREQTREPPPSTPQDPPPEVEELSLNDLNDIVNELFIDWRNELKFKVDDILNPLKRRKSNPLYIKMVNKAIDEFNENIMCNRKNIMLHLLTQLEPYEPQAKSLGVDFNPIFNQMLRFINSQADRVKQAKTLTPYQASKQKAY